MTRRRDLSPEEAKLWRRVAKTTKAYQELDQIAAPVFDAAVPETKSTKVAPELPHLALRRAKAVQSHARYTKSPIAKTHAPAPLSEASGHKKVRRGKLDIDARIDLHGMRQIDAQAALVAIVARIRSQGGRCILVITGKGRPIDPGEDFITPQPGVIRRRFPEWLNGQGVREHVSGYASAHAKDGGSGAFYVLLKSNKPL
jgi:DNA-nicking Smr family endonuclease